MSLRTKFLVFCTAGILWAAAAGGAAEARSPAADEAWYEAQLATLSADEQITADELHTLLKSGNPPVIFDARDYRTYDRLHIQGAVLPYADEFYRQTDLYKRGMVRRPPDPAKALAGKLARMALDTPIVTYCNSAC